MLKSIYPNWSAPKNVHALTTTRYGGVSLPPFHALNLGSHVDDNIEHVLENRRRLIQFENIPNQPYWLNQIHSTNVVDIFCNKINELEFERNSLNNLQIPDADASYTKQADCVSVVLTADCLPILICSKQGNEVAAIHAGWRGLCNGIIENSLQRFFSPKDKLIAWLGPAIGPTKFEVGQDVKDQFMAYDKQAEIAFKLIDATNKKYLANLYQLATQRLTRLGVSQVFGGEYCTYSQSDLFYSYRREATTGRMATLIWFS